MKYGIILIDPPWEFSDKLNNNADVKRGAQSQYDVLSINDIKKLKINELASENTLLALWVPSTLLNEGLEAMKEWGFIYRQNFIWVKIKKDPFKEFKKNIKQKIKLLSKSEYNSDQIFHLIEESCDNFDINSILHFLMGRTFRQTHEICLIGMKGKIYQELEDKSQRSVALHGLCKNKDGKVHSTKPEILQDRLEIMFPNIKNKLEIFARRNRLGWTCIGNESPDTIGEDIRDSIENLLLSKECESCNKIYNINENFTNTNPKDKKMICDACRPDKINYTLDDLLKKKSYQTFHNLRAKCKKRNIIFDDNLSVEYFYDLFQKNTHCNCCNYKLNIESNNQKEIASIDRLICEKGYTIDNIKIICLDCNLKKGDYLLEDFEKLLLY